MERKSTGTDDRRPKENTNPGATENEETFAFEGETLLHSPRLGRRFLRWLASRLD